MMQKSSPSTLPKFIEFLEKVHQKRKQQDTSVQNFNKTIVTNTSFGKTDEEEPEITTQSDSIFSGVLNSSKGDISFSTQEEYEDAVKKVATLGNQIGDGWFDPTKQALVEEHKQLAQAMLMYEIEHDLLPDNLL